MKKKLPVQPGLCTNCKLPPTERDDGKLIYTGGKWLCSRCAFLDEEEDTLDIRNRMYASRSLVGSSGEMATREIGGSAFTGKEMLHIAKRIRDLGHGVNYGGRKTK